MFRTLDREANRMSEYPSVTVLMCVYNDAHFVLDTIESILKQTWTDFEFIIIDDGSTDESVTVISSISDPRIKLIYNSQNLGLTASLIKGINMAKGKYIARIDADDIAHPKRLEKQVHFLENHREVGILGSPCLLFNAESENLGLYSVPVRDYLIRWTSLLNNPFAHPTIMLRRDILKQYNLNYDEKFPIAQDYELWMRLLKCTQGANLTEPLIKYRLREGVTTKKRREQLTFHDAIALRTIQSTLPNFTISLEQVTSMRSLFITQDFDQATEPLNLENLGETIKTYLQMLQIFLKKYSKNSEKAQLKKQEIKKIIKLLLRLSKQGGVDSRVIKLWLPQIRVLTQLLLV